MANRFLIQTFGCQMNVADTQRMSALLGDSGFEPTEDPDQADLILINGCSVREKAVHKAVSAFSKYQGLKKKLSTGSRRPWIGLGGCVGQLEKDSLFERAPYLDFVFGPDAIDELPEIVHRVMQGERKTVYTEFDSSSKFSTETRILPKQAQAFVNIMKGCDKYCTYCIVPFTRGREKSRTIDEVLEDMGKLISQGVTEVTLLGQNVNSFGKGNPNTQSRLPRELHNVIGRVGPAEDEENFPQLLWALETDSRMKGLRRIRFTSSHPLDFSDELLDCYHPVRGVTKLANHLHLPVQSGSDRVLRKMGRHHNIEGYISQMLRLREMRPDVGISTDIIVGFPTETDEEYQETLNLLSAIQYDSLYAFAYSPRPGTKAERTLEDDVPAQVKNERLRGLLAHQSEINRKRNRDRVGRKMEILVEGRARKEQLLEGHEAKSTHGVWTGRTSCNRVVNFTTHSGRDLTGSYQIVEITGSTHLALSGELDLQPALEEVRLQ